MTCRICNEPKEFCTKNCKIYYFRKPLSTRVRRLYHLAESQLDDHDPSLLNASLHVFAISNSDIVMIILEYTIYGGYCGQQDHARKHYAKLAAQKLNFVKDIKASTIRLTYFSCEIYGDFEYLILCFTWSDNQINIFANTLGNRNKIIVDRLAFEDFWDHILDFQNKLYLKKKIQSAVKGCKIMCNIGHKFRKSLRPYYTKGSYKAFVTEHKTSLYANVLETH